MITGSHNPPKFNGFKLKAHFGGPAGPDLCRAVEARLDGRPVRRLPLDQGRAEGHARVQDMRPAHFRAIKRLVEFGRVARARLRVAHDALYGVGAGCFEALLAGTSCRVTALNARHDPLFGGINPEPVEANYGATRAYLRRHPHDLCLVTDGDADRLGGMDGRGGVISTHQLICLLLYHLAVNRQQRGRVVKALNTTALLDKMCAAHGLPLTEVSVGFKHTCEEMLKGDVLLGGEESGGIGFAGHIPERDGLLAGLLLLELLAVSRQPIGGLIQTLERRFGPHRYARVDLAFPLERRTALLEWCRTHPPDQLRRSPVTRVDTFDGVKFTAADSSWLMLRGSGTEPVLRIYAEAASRKGALALLELGRRLTRQVSFPRSRSAGGLAT